MAEENAEQAEEIISGLDLSEVQERHPMSLSGRTKAGLQKLRDYFTCSRRTRVRGQVLS